MNLARRNFLSLAATAVALPALSRLALARTYPLRPVRIVVGFAAGASPDITARLMAQWLSERLGRQFFVDNRPGAGSNLPTDAVVRAPPDGYTLLWVTTPNAINATLYEKLNFNFIMDIAPVASVIRLPGVMVVHPSVPAKSVSEFITYAKANPNKLGMASTAGTTDHVSGELFKMMTGIEMVDVPYRGGGAPLYADLLSGQVQVSFPVTAASIGYIKAGKLRPLAVTTSSRWEGLPDIQSLSESIPGCESSVWHGVGAPKSTPAAIVKKLNNAINAGLVDANVKARLAQLGGTVIPGSSDDFRNLIADETDKWGKVVRFAGIKSE